MKIIEAIHTCVPFSSDGPRIFQLPYGTGEGGSCNSKHIGQFLVGMRDGKSTVIIVSGQFQKIAPEPAFDRAKAEQPESFRQKPASV